MIRHKRVIVTRPARHRVVSLLLAGLFVAAPGAEAVAQTPTHTLKPGVSPIPTPKLPQIPDGVQIEVPNWGFEVGLSGWEKTGDAFNHQPTFGDNVRMRRVANDSTRYKMPLGGDYWRDLGFPIGHKGGRWIGTYEKRPTPNIEAGATQGDAPRGTLTSKAFTVEKRYITFLIGGGKDLNKLRVELLERVPTGPLTFSDGKYRPVPGMAKTGANHELMRREWFDVRALQGKTVRLRIVDDSSGAWGHINVDDFQFQDMSPTTAPAPQPGADKQVRPFVFKPGDNSTRGYVDWDAPVWGAADLHTHPAAHLGFGGMLLQGAPDGPIDKELANCNVRHGGYGLFDNRDGNHIRSMVVGMLDEIYIHRQGPEKHMDHPHEGHPKYRYWPHFTTVTHQQMRHEWIKRAHEGGLRVMVGLAVNNQLLAEAIDGNNPKDDKESANKQIAYMRAFVNNHKDFMKIATSPTELRDIVREGKLAVILGVEIDNIGNFNYKGVDKSDAAIRKEIRRLYGLGVRYIFPIHVTDNAFGGAAVYSDMFNLSNRFAQVQPSTPAAGAAVPNTAYSVEHAPDPLVKFKLAPVIPNSDLSWIRPLVKMIELLAGPVILALENEPEYRVVKSYFLTPDPTTTKYDKIKAGHRNTKPLHQAGEVALAEMMRLGMLIDIDHASEKAVDKMLGIAEKVPGGYPLLSGHNGFRAMRSDASENQRSDQQVQRLLNLNGMMGVGYGYEPDKGGQPNFAQVIAKRGGRSWTRSNVAANCGGSSRRFAQNYLYALEKMAGAGVALGTDINGLFPGPGPRFGELATLDGNRCTTQTKPIHYAGVVAARKPGDPPAPTPANEPLVMGKTGERRWNYNVDGMAHYGMLPDFFQDLRNVGVTPPDLTPLFSSAEHLAQTWDRALRNAPK